MVYDFDGLPSPLGWRSALFAGSSENDLVDAAKGIFNGGGSTMYFTLVVASETCMFLSFGQSVRPTIK